MLGLDSKTFDFAAILSRGLKADATREFEGIAVKIRAADGYINVSSLARAGGKQFKDYRKHTQTKQIIPIIKTELQKIDPSLEPIVQAKQHHGSYHYYAHPLIAIDMAGWLSPTFKIIMLSWVFELVESTLLWQVVDEAVIESSTREVGLKPEQIAVKKFCETFLLDQEYQLEFPVYLGTDGYIDILTEHELYEVKHWRKWRHAVGQALAYHLSFKDRQAFVVLFDSEDDPVDTEGVLTEIEEAINQCNVEMKYLRIDVIE